MISYRLTPGIRWRCWDDGCVVFCAATARTLLLSPEYRSLLGAAAPDGESAIDTSHEAEAVRVGQLVELGILEWLP